VIHRPKKEQSSTHSQQQQQQQQQTETASSATQTTINNQSSEKEQLEELVSLRFENQQLKIQNNQILEHLQDAREYHLESEVEALMSLVPQRAVPMVYTCKDQNEALRQCYQEHLLSKDAKHMSEENVITLDIMKCRPIVNQFIQCANEARRKFLQNNDL
jgi:leucyl aminopeptidase